MISLTLRLLDPETPTEQETGQAPQSLLTLQRIKYLLRQSGIKPRFFGCQIKTKFLAIPPPPRMFHFCMITDERFQETKRQHPHATELLPASGPATPIFSRCPHTGHRLLRSNDWYRQIVETNTRTVSIPWNRPHQFPSISILLVCHGPHPTQSTGQFWSWNSVVKLKEHVTK